MEIVMTLKNKHPLDACVGSLTLAINPTDDAGLAHLPIRSLTGNAARDYRIGKTLFETGDLRSSCINAAQRRGWDAAKRCAS